MVAVIHIDNRIISVIMKAKIINDEIVLPFMTNHRCIESGSDTKHIIGGSFEFKNTMTEKSLCPVMKPPAQTGK